MFGSSRWPVINICVADLNVLIVSIITLSLHMTSSYSFVGTAIDNSKQVDRVVKLSKEFRLRMANS